MSISHVVQEQADSLKKEYKDLSSFEALQIATKIAQVDAYRQAHVIDISGVPSALESIAECLGKGEQFSYTITDALTDISRSLSNVSTAIEKLNKEDE